jgi:putative ABC transport system permease protein
MILGNYLIAAVRNFTKRKFYSFINAFGLSIAIAFCFVVYLFITDEITFDNFHAKRDRIYRINNRSFSNLAFEQGQEDPYRYFAVLSTGLGTALREQVPEAEHITQLKQGGKQTIRYEDNVFSQNIMFADSGFFNIFSFELIAGSYNQLFKQPSDAVITPEAAEKLFGNEDPIGKTFYLDFEESVTPAYTVKAVVSCPANSSITFEVLLPLESYKPFLSKSWNINSYPTFVLLQEQADVMQFRQTLNTILVKNRAESIARVRSDNNVPANMIVEEYTLTRLPDVHFEKRINWPKVSDPRYSWILGGIALLIISIASINYISFALTASANRRKEIAIRKTVGASRTQIFQQFNFESFSLVCFAAFLGVILAIVLLPVFNSLTQKNISVLSINIAPAIAFLALLVVTISLMAGSYPSLFASRVNPALALKGSSTGMRALFAKPLVVLQFAMSAFLMISSIIMYQQMHFIATKNLGYNANNAIVVPTNLGWGKESDQAIERFRNEAKNNPDIIGVSGTSGSFIRGGMSMTFDYKDSEHLVHICRADHEYTSLLNIEIVQGRNFDAGSVSDSSAILVNEALVKDLGWTDPLNERLNLSGEAGDPGLNVIGVMKDYHFLSLEEEIKPLILGGSDYLGGYLITLIVKLNDDDLPKSLSAAEQTWKKLYPDKPFDYTFADAEVAEQYASYSRWMKITGTATTIAVIIASLGLFGLAGINAANRTKEISIRKILGADFSHIFLQLNKPFFTLAALAFIIAIPVSWQLMNQWLSNFKYHITAGWELFAISLGLGLLVVLATLSYHSIKAARVNPADTLRRE